MLTDPATAEAPRTASVEEALAREVRISLPVHDVALLVLELLLELGVPRARAVLGLEFGPERVAVLDEGDAEEVLRVWDAWRWIGTRPWLIGKRPCLIGKCTCLM